MPLNKLNKGKINLTKQQAIFLGVVGAVVLVFVLIFLGAIPGKRSSILKTDLVVWGIDDAKAWSQTISRFRRAYPNINVKYVEIEPANYEAELINGLAAGRGPDVFMFSSKWLLKQGDKVAPISPDKMTPVTFSGLFTQVAEKDFISEDRIYAMPLTGDTLALIYNRDIFDQNQIVFPPKTWDEFSEDVLKITRKSGDEITQSAASIGGTSKSVPNASDLISLLMLQGGAPMVSKYLNRADFEPGGEQAVTLYTKFATKTSKYYTWNDSFAPSDESFAAGKTAVAFGYPDDVKKIKDTNPFIDLSIHQIPQFDVTNPVNFANYWGLAASIQTSHKDAAWDFIIFATTDNDSAQSYITETGRSPALRSLINTYLNNPNIGVFAAQALTATSWPQIDDAAISDAFDGMIDSVISKGNSPADAIKEARSKITQLMRTDQ